MRIVLSLTATTRPERVLYCPRTTSTSSSRRIGRRLMPCVFWRSFESGALIETCFSSFVALKNCLRTLRAWDETNGFVFIRERPWFPTASRQFTFSE
ncbi:hypothetical protein TRFO_07383 [Tritrichomonas foetus]|uniref:Uncharacterized protein n=1 Tax=Tritrichomonas foetus TaxID=1144522 RepID=A0A1J4JX19_9EUKA|nr:hypothetical protein TRFO_07383 [Tritrichomonas foetus]|eukprot:OHT01821.1 hypothetical protein TRFO_07383 [Tritrichomonas foetus]